MSPRQKINIAVGRITPFRKRKIICESVCFLLIKKPLIRKKVATAGPFITFIKTTASLRVVPEKGKGDDTEELNIKIPGTVPDAMIAIWIRF